MTKTRAFLLAVLLLGLTAACGGGGDGGKGATTSTSAPGGNSVDIQDFQFKPSSLTVAAGSTVTWTNRDSFAHSVKPEGAAFPTSPDIGPAKTFQHTFEKAGTFKYICGIHNSMTGTVVVK